MSEMRLSTTEEADSFGRFLAHALAARGEWPRRLQMNCDPTAPAETKTRRLPLEGAREIPWRVERDPRLQITLALPRSADDAAADVELEEDLRRVLDSIQRFLDERPVYGELQINGVLTRGLEAEIREDERFFELRVELTVLTV